MLHNKIPFGLKLYSLGLLLSENIENCFADYEMSGKTFFYLLFPYLQPGISQDSVSKYFKSNKSTTARILKKLETKGLIERREDLSFKKANRIYLTDEGMQLITKMEQAITAWENKIFEEDENKNIVKDKIDKMFLNALFIRDIE